VTAALQDSLVSMVLASIVLLAAVSVKWAVVHARLHHQFANRGFKRRYRTEHPLSGRTAAPAPLPPAALLDVRSRIRRAWAMSPPAPVGIQRGQHST
jgi:hypothetical protein